MSLGQLTAYADSDAEDYSDEEKQITDHKSPSTDSNTKSEKVEEQFSNSEIPPIVAKKDSPKSHEPVLTGIIEDEDDYRPTQTTKSVSSPPHLRVGELRAEDAGSGKSSPASNTSGFSSKNTPTKKKKLNRLVSYYNEDDDMEKSSESEDENDEVRHSEPMDTGSTDGEDTSPITASSTPSSPHTKNNAVVVDGITLPPAPAGKKCSQALQDKVSRAISEIQRGGKNINAKIQNTKEFRNPSIYEKLVDHLRLDENGSNYPVSLYDPHNFSRESFYENLAKTQKEEMDKKEKERKERTKTEFVSGAKKTGTEEEIKKRKSRFDAGRPDGLKSSTLTKPVSLVSNIASSSLGGKTVIDAFGSLNKKVKSWRH